MRIVTIAAALIFASAGVARADDVPQAAASNLDLTSSCTAHPMVEHTAYTTDDDAECSDCTADCAQGLSTQDIFKPAPNGRT